MNLSLKKHSRLFVLAVALLLTLSISQLQRLNTQPLPLSSSSPTTQGFVAETSASTNAPNSTEILRLINNERQKAGVAPVTIDARLNTSSQIKANSMSTDGYGHVDKNGIHGYELAHNAMPQCRTTSENLDAAQTSEEAVREWLESPPHKAAMLDSKYQYAGFAVVPHENYYYIVHHMCAI